MPIESGRDNLDAWKDEFLVTSDISQERFLTLPDAQKLWLIENKHIFYNVNGGPILNLLHSKYKQMARTLRPDTRTWGSKLRGSKVTREM